MSKASQSTRRLDEVVENWLFISSMSKGIDEIITKNKNSGDLSILAVLHNMISFKLLNTASTLTHWQKVSLESLLRKAEKVKWSLSDE